MQTSIFACEPLGFDSSFAAARRIALGGAAWVEHVPGWLSGSERLYRELAEAVAWRALDRRMFERTVRVPRLLGSPPEAGWATDLLVDVARALGRRYQRCLPSVSLAWYRDGSDSVAMHGDRMGRLVDDCIVAILALGGPRRLLLREVAGRGAQAFPLGWGDLLVMGGRCQRTWRHGIPKVARADPRISIMFRERAEARPEGHLGGASTPHGSSRLQTASSRAWRTLASSATAGG